MTGGDAPTETFGLSLQGELTIYRAAEIKQTLLDALGRGGAIDVDLSQVTEIDAAGVQLLMLAKQLADARKCELRVVASSPTVLEVMELLNLKSLFATPPAGGQTIASPGEVHR